MVRSFFFGIIALLSWACSPAQETSKTSARLAHDSLDSTKYELIITDIYFDQWYLLHFDPSKDHLNEYYHAKNLMAVQKWNDYYRTGQYMQVIDSYIDYQPDIEYGIELNRRLYWYFKYVTTEFRIHLFL